MTPHIHVRSGVSRYRRRRGLEQKGVDILLAIEALQHAALGNIDTACFMLSDLDFYPLFDALVQTRVKSTLYYDPHNTSKDLIYSADVAFALNAGALNSWLRDDLGSTALSKGRFNYGALAEEQKAICGGRTINIGKDTSDHYIAHYEDSNEGYRGLIPYMLLSMFEDAPGQKVTGAKNFGFP
jgi:hypothetical protein